MMIGGEIVSAAGPVAAPESASARTVNVWSRPVDALVPGWTEFTPAMVNTSPAFRMPVVEFVQPSVFRVCDQVFFAVAYVTLCEAPLTSGVPVATPTVCVGMKAVV
jgi:hypothetical protein